MDRFFVTLWTERKIQSVEWQQWIRARFKKVALTEPFYLSGPMTAPLMALSKGFTAAAHQIETPCCLEELRSQWQVSRENTFKTQFTLADIVDF